MFCHMCGNKLVEGARFCSKCGTKAKEITSVNNVDLVSEIVDTKHNSKVKIRQVIEKFFTDYCSCEGYDADNIYLFPEDCKKEVIDNFVKYPLLPNENPLIIFNYKNNFRQGFLITDERFIWNYETIRGEWYLKDIGSIDIVKYISTVDAMMLFDRHMSKYSSYIILTHLYKPYLFMFRFALFLYELNYSLNSDFDFEIDYILKYVAYSIGKTKDFSYRWKMKEIPKYYKEVSDGDIKFYKQQEDDMRKLLSIPEKYKLYFAMVTQYNRKHSYAITDHGIFYKNTNDSGVITWMELKECKIIMLDVHNFSVNGIVIEVDTQADQHVELLRNLQYATVAFWGNCFSKAKVAGGYDKVEGIKITKIPQNIVSTYEADIKKISMFLGDMRFNFGLPLKIDRLVSEMKESLGVEAIKKVFFLMPTSGFGKNKKGFIIAEDGFYYRNESGGVGKILWDKYIDQKISKDVYIYVEKNGFNVGLKAGTAILNLLVGMQEYIKGLYS